MDGFVIDAFKYAVDYWGYHRQSFGFSFLYMHHCSIIVIVSILEKNPRL